MKTTSPTPRKLKLEIETLKTLSGVELEHAVGGAATDPVPLTIREPSWCICQTLR